MNTIIRTTIACMTVACVTTAATPSVQKRLTAKRVTELTAPPDAPAPQGYLIEVSDLGICRFPTPKPGDAKHEAVLEQIREYRFPTEFDPPQSPADGKPALTPTTPSAFETINAGWTVRLTVRPHGKLVAITGAADYVAVELLPGGYGAVAGPIYSDDGTMLTSNRLDQPKVQTTTTRFHIFALPDEPYAVTLYRGSKPEKHTFTVKSQ